MISSPSISPPNLLQGVSSRIGMSAVPTDILEDALLRIWRGGSSTEEGFNQAVMGAVASVSPYLYRAKSNVVDDTVSAFLSVILSCDPVSPRSRWEDRIGYMLRNPPDPLTPTVAKILTGRQWTRIPDLLADPQLVSVESSAPTDRPVTKERLRNILRFLGWAGIRKRPGPGHPPAYVYVPISLYEGVQFKNSFLPKKVTIP